MYKKSNRYDSKGGQIFPPQKYELIHNQQLNKNGKNGSKTRRKDGSKTGRKNGSKTGRKEAKQEERKDGGKTGGRRQGME